MKEMNESVPSFDVEPGEVPGKQIDINIDDQNTTQGEEREGGVVSEKLQVNDDSGVEDEDQDDREDFSLPSGIFGF